MTHVTEHDVDPAGSRLQLVTAEAAVRDKNQVTLPKAVVQAMDVHVGDRVIFVLDECDPTVVHMYRPPESYAGALAGVYGTAEEAKAHLQSEREAWGE